MNLCAFSRGENLVRAGEVELLNIGEDEDSERKRHGETPD